MKSIYQFQIGNMLNPELYINKAFKEKVKMYLADSFNIVTMTPVVKVLKKGGKVFFTFDILWNRNNVILKVLTSIVYCIMENYECVDYLCFPKKTKLLVTSKERLFEKIIYNGFSTVGIPEILTSII